MFRKVLPEPNPRFEHRRQRGNLTREREKESESNKRKERILIECAPRSYESTLARTATPVRVPPSASEEACLPRKEVIQPLVPQRLPCYDFIPITTHTLGGRNARLRVQTAFMM